MANRNLFAMQISRHARFRHKITLNFANPPCSAIFCCCFFWWRNERKTLHIHSKSKENEAATAAAKNGVSNLRQINVIFLQLLMQSSHTLATLAERRQIRRHLASLSAFKLRGNWRLLLACERNYGAAIMQISSQKKCYEAEWQNQQCLIGGSQCGDSS